MSKTRKQNRPNPEERVSDIIDEVERLKALQKSALEDAYEALAIYEELVNG